MYFVCPYGYMIGYNNLNSYQNIPCQQYHNYNSYSQSRSSFDSPYQRGKVRTIIFEVEYPDGSIRVARMNNARNVSHIIFNDRFIPSQDISLFNVSRENWSLNPTMLAYEFSPTSQIMPISPFDPVDDTAKPRPRPLCSNIKCGLHELPSDFFKIADSLIQDDDMPIL
ncbi:hypothetical protein L1S24_01570 [Clostridium sporogenes]|uniref:hypothetical protein n=1 Tax=Clostridium sporogenes TaxID=1509 RepID=UPI001F33D932|nr:hypothetical protein [Clostridium sporogenes]MCF4015835.1 hypothetical protein [Clostridium sporogenes]